jgi:hypothetical protein
MINKALGILDKTAGAGAGAGGGAGGSSGGGRGGGGAAVRSSGENDELSRLLAAVSL